MLPSSPIPSGSENGPPVIHPLRTRPRIRPLQVAFLLALVILLFGDLFGNWPLSTSHAFAAQLQTPAKGVQTLKQFMQLPGSHTAHGPAIPKAPTSNSKPKSKPSKPLSSLQPTKMKPIHVPLTSSALTPAPTSTPFT